MPEQEIHTTIRLLRGARSGDRESLDQLFERYLPIVRRTVSLRLGRPLQDLSTCDDLVQESLLRAFEKLDSFRELSEGTFRNWISTCVASAVHLHFKRAGAAKRGGGRVRALGELGASGLSAAIFADPAAGPGTVASLREEEERLERALLELRPHQREVIVLRHICAMDAAEVARAMGFASAETARKALSRAMRELRRRLESGAPHVATEEQSAPREGSESDDRRG